MHITIFQSVSILDLSMVFLKRFCVKIKLFCTHSLGFKVLFDCEAVHHAGRQALLYAGQEKHQDGKDLKVHSEQNPSKNG